MVKRENGVVSKEDRDGDCQELLSPPQPSSPTNSISLAASKVANGCNVVDDDAEQEPLLQKAVNNKSEVLTTPSKANGNNLQNGDLTIPIYVTSDRLSVDTAATASLHSSPSHPANRGSPVINPAMLQTALAGSSTSRDQRHLNPGPQPDEVVAIQMTSAHSCRNVNDSRPALSDREVFECSWKSMCGPNPKKMTIGIVVLLSIWASFILGLNVYKQVSGLEDNLAFMTEKVHNLQRNYVQMQDLALLEIEKLKHHIEELKNRPHHSPSYSRPSESSPPETHRQAKSIDLAKESMMVTTSRADSKQLKRAAKPVSTTSTTSTAAAPPSTVASPVNEECTTVDGLKCIFPFTYKGVVKTGCVQTWTDIKPWCATKVDGEGKFIHLDNSAWGNCNSSCPMS